ncbi:hypothetical protein SPHINGO8BC_60431 [Sphingobacterium multivorum]|uniref:Uncharacterized protein n=1 Tax=Sphingobacterium multivorum TaxID=28454 RepID=A0A654DIP1_SPHMU|nr:hypothetical protein SPHINGO8BC_60431 [Sphingobacterium multivorum]
MFWALQLFVHNSRKKMVSIAQLQLRHLLFIAGLIVFFANIILLSRYIALLRSLISSY